MAIAAEQVRILRERTGAGMMDCKRALEEAGGEAEKAVAILRERGLASIAKRVGRMASEGLVAACVTPDRLRGALVEVNCETDFVAKNADFIAFVKAVADKAVETNELAQSVADDGDALGGLTLGDGQTVGAALTTLCAKTGEHMTIRRYARFVADQGPGVVTSYIHLGGKIGALIELGCSEAVCTDPALLGLAKDLSMQVAAAKPDYIARSEVPAGTVAQEKAIYKAQAMNEGKQEHVAQKIVTGRLEKFFKDVCLLEQPFVKDQNQSCLQVIETVSGQLDAPVTVRRFARFERGEGLARRAGDLTVEIQAQLVKK